MYLATGPFFCCITQGHNHRGYLFSLGLTGPTSRTHSGSASKTRSEGESRPKEIAIYPLLQLGTCTFGNGVLSILSMTIWLVKLYGKLKGSSGKGCFYYPTNSTSFLGPLPWLGGGVKIPSQVKRPGNEIETNSTHVPFSLSTPVLIFFFLS